MTDTSTTSKSTAPGVDDFTDALGAGDFWKQRADAFSQQGLALAIRLADTAPEIDRQKDDLDKQVADAQANLDATKERVERDKKALDRTLKADQDRLAYIKSERDKALAEFARLSK